METTLTIDGVCYRIWYTRLPEKFAPTVLCLVSYMPNKQTENLVRIAVASLQRHTTAPYTLCVVDNASPVERLAWLRQQKDVVLLENRTPPKNGSYANAVGLEIARKMIPADTRYFMSLHQDIMVTKDGWLEYLLGKFSDHIRAVGVREDRTRIPEGVLHVLGYIVDFQLVNALNLDYFPRLPKYDTGDYIIDELRKHGFGYFSTPNTQWYPELTQHVPERWKYLLFEKFKINFSFNDHGEIFFLHLGRGVVKTISSDRGYEKYIDAWISAAKDVLGNECPHLHSFINTVSIPKDAYASCRRRYLDAFLETTPWCGRVLDVGGKKMNKRGMFRPPLGAVESWDYVNTDPSTQPDFLASAEHIPAPDSSYDMVLLSEVLEHLAEPENALAEAFRVLRSGGILICAAPFLFPLHADPEDYQRWLPSKYERVLGAIGFVEIRITPMGGFFAVCHDLLQSSSRFWLQQEPRGGTATLLRWSVPVGLRFLFSMERRFPHFFRQAANTGYYVTATHP